MLVRRVWGWDYAGVDGANYVHVYVCLFVCLYRFALPYRLLGRSPLTNSRQAIYDQNTGDYQMLG